MSADSAHFVDAWDSYWGPILVSPTLLRPVRRTRALLASLPCYPGDLMSGKKTPTSFTTITQQFLARPRGAQRLASVWITESQGAAAFLSVWSAKDDPAGQLLAADRHDVIPIGPNFSGEISLDLETAGAQVAVTTGDDATGAPAGAIYASFRWE